ncbi:hypothetical protein [Corynebacterium hindlerae]|uniref:hypothetical protein n=1 Tax=Corynebacterium hindlerae TaxID=699041 RepID=UPI003AAB6002
MSLEHKKAYERGLVEQLERLDRTLVVLSEAVEGEPLVTGSRGQVVVNPAARNLASLHRTRADIAKALAKSRASFGMNGL